VQTVQPRTEQGQDRRTLGHDSRRPGGRDEPASDVLTTEVPRLPRLTAKPYRDQDS